MMYHMCELVDNNGHPLFVKPETVLSVAANGMNPKTESVVRAADDPGGVGPRSHSLLVRGDTRQVNVALRLAAAECAEHERLKKALKRLASVEALVQAGAVDVESRARMIFAKQVCNGLNPDDFDLEWLAQEASRESPSQK